MQVLTEQAEVLKTPAPTVDVSALADSSVNFAVRPWVKTEDYWDFFFDARPMLKDAVESCGATIPFPQRDVHLFKDAS